MRVKTVALSALLLLACDEPPTEPCEPLEIGFSVVTSGEDDLDILFVIDNSGSMTEEQASLAVALPGLFDALLMGDLDGDGERDVEPVSSLQLGVVTADLGTGGHTVPTCMPSDFGDDGVLRTTGRTDIAGCPATVPSFMGFSPEDDPTSAAFDLACVTQAGTGGCGFEQQLEAMLKALSPSRPSDDSPPDDRPPVFFGDTSGHGDGDNAGFLRANSTLIVVMLTDEEDCSAADPGLFDPLDPDYRDTDLNLRCVRHPEALHSIDRYVDGLLSLREWPGDIVFVPIVGIPPELATRPNGYTDWGALIGPVEMRDPRLVGGVDPAMPTRLVPSCNLPGRGLAFAPIRILETAEQLQRQGARVSVQSICQESFEGIMDSVMRQLRSPVSADCISTALTRGPDGRVDCTMRVTLPPDVACESVPGATPHTGADGVPEAVDGRPVCDVAQRPVDAAARASEAPPAGDGFWLDDYVGPFVCEGPPFRLALPPLPARSRVRLRCPVTTLADSIEGDPCDPTDDTSCLFIPGRDLACDPVTERCAETCSYDYDCARFFDASCAIEEGATVGVCRRNAC
ncbi:MAG: hypothetical protein AB8I08_23575 [Sandaracinaceae bacterium]